MFANAIVLAAALYGVDVGWQRTDDGDLEYIIQIEPQLIEAMRDGEAITSEILPELRGVRRYRIVVGNDELPRTELPAVEEEAVEEEPEAAQTPLPFEPDSETESIQQAAGEEVEPSADDVVSSSEPEAAQSSITAAVAEPKAWILTLLCLFASIGGNAYFLWLTFDTRKRYRMLVRDLAPGS